MCCLHFTRLDASASFLPDAQSTAHGSTAIQLCGMITTSCGGASAWWENPGFSMRLREDSNVTIVLNQPNFRVLGLPEEEHSVEVGFICNIAVHHINYVDCRRLGSEC